MNDFDKLAADLRKAPDLLDAEVHAVLFKGAMKIKKAANKRAPKPIRRSVQFEMADADDGVEVVIETKSEFGAIFEFGTPTNPGGSPFMEPSVEEDADEIEKFLLKAGRKALP